MFKGCWMYVLLCALPYLGARPLTPLPVPAQPTRWLWRPADPAASHGAWDERAPSRIVFPTHCRDKPLAQCCLLTNCIALLLQNVSVLEYVRLGARQQSPCWTSPVRSTAC